MLLRCSLLVCLALCGCRPSPAQFSDPTADDTPRSTANLQFGQREQLGAIQARQINEASGLAASRQHAGMYWVHNDNGRHPGLFLIDSSGRHRATVQLAGAPFQDWEDMAAVTIDGESHLVLADCGDNSFRREECRLYVLKEPHLLDSADHEPADEPSPVELTVDEFETIRFRYPDGPRDCEAMAVDATGTGTVFLITKQHTPDHPRMAVYQLALQSADRGQVQVATRLDTPFDAPLVTGMDISPNGQLCVVRSYSSAWVFRRADDESWQDTLQSEPEVRSLLPLQRQGEAVCFTHDDSGLVITSEGRRQSLWKIELTSDPDRR